MLFLSRCTKSLLKLLKVLFHLNPEEFALTYPDLLATEASRQLATNIHIVVLDNPENDITGANAFSALSSFKLAGLLYIGVDVRLADTTIRQIIVGHVVDVVFVQEVEGQHPRTRTNDLVHPLAVHQDFAPFRLVHHDFAFLSDSFLIT